LRCRSWSWRTSMASRAGLEGCSKAVWACRFVHTLCTPFVINVHRHPTSDLDRRCCHRRILLRPFLMARLTAGQPLLPLLWQLRVNLYSPSLTQPTHCCARVCSLPVPAHLTRIFRWLATCTLACSPRARSPHTVLPGARWARPVLLPSRLVSVDAILQRRPCG
jgi:hypothetical protein